MSHAQTTPSTTALANWFGSNRTLAPEVGRRLGKLRKAFVPFAGGCCEIPYIDARCGVASDLHCHVINLAKCVSDRSLCEQVLERCDEMLVHWADLRAAQRLCGAREREVRASRDRGLFGGWPMPGMPDVAWAAAYMACSWMTRGGHSGKRGELDQSLATRYTSSGGDSAVRFRSAVSSLAAWRDALDGWTFECIDWREMLSRVRDEPGHGIYCDPPWPDAGEEYQHRFTESDHRDLADVLRSFHRARIVVRYGNHELVRALYPATDWTIVEQASRNQQGGECGERLIVRRCE